MRTIAAENIQGPCQFIFDLVKNGGPVTVEGPSDKVVVMSESEYREIEKARHNAEYIAMLERSSQQAREGKVIFKTLEELRALTR